MSEVRRLESERGSTRAMLDIVTNAAERAKTIKPSEAPAMTSDPIKTHNVQRTESYDV